MSRVISFSKFLLVAIVLAIAVLLIPNWHADMSLEKLKNLYAQPPSGWVEVQGMNVHYRDEGQGPAVLLLHGTAANLHTWNGWTELLKSDYRVIRMDLPGFGLTGPFPNRSYAPSDYVSFIEAFRNALNLDSFYIAGNSLGGLICWNYTLDNPEVVKGMILLDPAGFPQDRPVTLAFKMAKTPLLRNLMEYITPESLIKKSLLEVYHNDDLVTDSLTTVYFHSLLRKGNRQAFADRVNSSEPMRLDELKKINTPTLLQWGEDDQWIPLAHATMFDTQLPNSRLIVYAEAGHIPQEEVPEITAADARRFFRSLSSLQP